MAQNPMDNMTAKEREEAMGLSESQKMQLEAAGLTAKEIKEIHYQRVAESIAKERERLDKLEKKVKKNLPDFLAALLDDDSEKAIAKGEELSPDVVKQLQEGLPPEDKTPWHGEKNLIMSNEDYWVECDKELDGNKDFDIPDDVLDMDDEEFEKWKKGFDQAYNGKTKEIFNRRWLGAQKAWYDWVKGGCKGTKPEDVSMLMGMGSL